MICKQGKACQQLLYPSIIKSARSWADTGWKNYFGVACVAPYVGSAGYP